MLASGEATKYGGVAGRHTDLYLLAPVPFGGLVLRLNMVFSGGGSCVMDCVDVGTNAWTLYTAKRSVHYGLIREGWTSGSVGLMLCLGPK